MRQRRAHSLPCRRRDATRRCAPVRLHLPRREGLSRDRRPVARSRRTAGAGAVDGPVRRRFPWPPSIRTTAEVRSRGLPLWPVAYSSDVVDLPTSAFEALQGVERLDRRRAALHAASDPRPRRAQRSAGSSACGRDAPSSPTCTSTSTTPTLAAALPPGVEPAFDGLALRVHLKLQRDGPRLPRVQQRQQPARHRGGDQRRRLGARPRLVVSNRRAAPALDFARSHGDRGALHPHRPGSRGR